MEAPPRILRCACAVPRAADTACRVAPTQAGRLQRCCIEAAVTPLHRMRLPADTVVRRVSESHSDSQLVSSRLARSLMSLFTMRVMRGTMMQTKMEEVRAVGVCCTCWLQLLRRQRRALQPGRAHHIHHDAPQHLLCAGTGPGAALPASPI